LRALPEAAHPGLHQATLCIDALGYEALIEV